MPGYKRVNGFTLRGTFSLEGGCKKNLGEKRVSPFFGGGAQNNLERLPSQMDSFAIRQVKRG